MRAVRLILPAGRSVTVTPAHALAVLASIAALLVFGAYLQLLHDAVERGGRFRAQTLPAVAKTAPSRLEPLAARHTSRRWVATAGMELPPR